MSEQNRRKRVPGLSNRRREKHGDNNDDKSNKPHHRPTKSQSFSYNHNTRPIKTLMCHVAKCANEAEKGCRGYCKLHEPESFIHDAAIVIQSHLKGWIARRSYDQMIINKILEEEKRREAEDLAALAEVEHMVEDLQEKDNVKRQTWVKDSETFRKRDSVKRDSFKKNSSLVDLASALKRESSSEDYLEIQAIMKEKKAKEKEERRSLLQRADSFKVQKNI